MKKTEKVQVELPLRIHDLLTGVALVNGADPAEWIPKFVADAAIDELRMGLDTIGRTPLFTRREF